jgi:hypothetical protein
MLCAQSTQHPSCSAHVSKACSANILSSTDTYTEEDVTKQVVRQMQQMLQPANCLAQLQNHNYYSRRKSKSLEDSWMLQDQPAHMVVVSWACPYH